MMTNDTLQNKIGEILQKEGIPLFGFAPLPSRQELESILNPGYLDSLPQSLSFLKKPAWRDPRFYLPWAKSAVCVAVSYNTTRELSRNHIAKGKAWISRYAWGDDYHRVLRKKLKPLNTFLIANGFKARIAVDSFPLLEKTMAIKAGIGFKCRSGVIINPKYGSFLFLGEVITDAEFPTAEPMNSLCKDCRICVSACPSKALAGDGSVNPSLCVSSITVEWKGDLPGNTPPLSGRLFGCDICQEVCPFNRDAPLSREKAFEPRPGLFAPDIIQFLGYNDEKLINLIEGTPLERKGVDGLRNTASKIRNECQTKSDETELSS
jgi:epoxyqueuosine reductase